MKHRTAPYTTVAAYVIAASGLLGNAHATDLFVQSTGVGIGTDAPQRQLHLVGPNAVFRMDRNIGTAAFLLVRTNDAGTPLKTFVVGTDATGSNNGEFVINDLGAAVSGAGTRRMTIANNGAVTFTGNLVAATVNSSSTIRLKQDVQTIENPIAGVQALRGVRFNWRESGEPSLGLIAEEVISVFPEAVSVDPADGQPTAVNYSALIGVLVEAVKAQQATIASQGQAIEELQRQINTLGLR